MHNNCLLLQFPLYQWFKDPHFLQPAIFPCLTHFQTQIVIIVGDINTQQAEINSVDTNYQTDVII